MFALYEGHYAVDFAGEVAQAAQLDVADDGVADEEVAQAVSCEHLGLGELGGGEANRAEGYLPAANLHHLMRLDVWSQGDATSRGSGGHLFQVALHLVEV